MTKDAWTVENYFDDIPHLPPFEAGFEHIQSIVLVGPHPGEIRHVTSDSENDAHTSTSHEPVYYHEEDAVRLQLDGLAGAGPGAGTATCTAALRRL